MNIPVFHDDQHGTAIIVGAAVLNALEIVSKHRRVRLATAGAGAGYRLFGYAGRAGHEARQHLSPFDREGVISRRPVKMDPDKLRYARDTDKRTLADIVDGADIFLGLSAGGVLKPEMVATMAAKPIIPRWRTRYRRSCRRMRRRCARIASHRPQRLPEPKSITRLAPHLPRCARRRCRPNPTGRA